VALFDPAPIDTPRSCPRCGTQLSPFALACPACAALVHRERLQELAALAAASDSGGNRVTARQHWQEALALVPPHSEQHRLIGDRIAALAGPAGPGVPGGATGPVAAAAHASGASWWVKGAGVAITGALLIGGKLKFLLLGLTKASTFVSMFGFAAVYWSLYGWPLALGLVGSIYIHEMGHVSVLRALGIQSGAPLFIPGVGALVMLKERITDPVIDARIGLAGPVWGLCAAVAAFAVYFVTGAPIWYAIAELTGLLNLFNLIPIWQLDGSRGFHALRREDRWVVVGAVAIMLLLTGQRLLWIIGAVAAWRALKGEPGPGHTHTLITYVGLIAALSWFARGVQ
jgi:Zn-dependent protease